jgi:ribosomal protein S12 methylthiotransferase
MEAKTETAPAPAPGASGEVRIHLISLGCPKNLVDSEMILGHLGAEGLVVTPSAEEADVIIVNTCGFVESAKEESINTILEACRLKEESKNRKKVVAAGCLAQRYGSELRREIPELDAIVGLGEYGDLDGTLRGLLKARRRKPLLRVSDPTKACNAEVGRFRLTPAHYAYIRISEGCDNPCTFCAIPAIRGRFRSKPIEACVAEARELVASGAREVVLISQDTTSYGADLDGSLQLPRLLESLAQVDGLRWIRLLYAYPAFFTDEMIDAVASIDKVVKYIDMPLQHISNRMLRHMGRRMDEKKTRALLERMRRRITGLYLRTTFIVGFPGEDEAEFGTLRDFVREFRFERLGVFPYSREEGTPAASFAGQVPQQIVKERLEELMLLQQEIAFQHNEARRGELVEVVIDSGPERIGKSKEQLYRARSFGEAPEIDPSVLIPCGRRQNEPPRGATAPSGGFLEIPLGVRPAAAGARREQDATLRPGQFLTARITGSRDYDLVAEIPAGSPFEP